MKTTWEKAFASWRVFKQEDTHLSQLGGSSHILGSEGGPSQQLHPRVTSPRRGESHQGLSWTSAGPAQPPGPGVQDCPRVWGVGVRGLGLQMDWAERGPRHVCPQPSHAATA